MIAILTGVAEFVWKHWRLFAAGAVVAVLIAMLLIARGDASHFKKLYENQVQLTASANAKLSISNASIDTLQAALDSKNAESEQRARDYAAAKAADTATIAEMDKRQEADSSRIQTLLKLAKDLPENPQCRVPAALSAQIEGL